MKKLFFVLVCVGLLFFPGCALLPEVRIFEKKMPDPVPQFVVTESQRQAADVIARNPEVPAYLRPVTFDLSASLGSPIKPIFKDTPLAEALAASAALRTENANLRARVEKQAEFLKKYAGKTIDGTGVDVFAPLSFLGVGGVVALFVFVPGTLTAALWVIRKLRGTVQTMAQGIEEYAVKNPKQAAELKDNYLSSAMDKAHKAVVKREKNYIDKTNINAALKTIAANATAPT